MKKIFNVKIFIVLFALLLSTKYSFAQVIITEDFEYDESGENPLNHCGDLGNFINNGFYPDWSSYNNHPVYIDVNCPQDNNSGIWVQDGFNNWYSVPYDAYGNNSICLTSGSYAFSKINPLTAIGYGLLYKNPAKLYFGFAQKYHVNFKMTMPLSNGPGTGYWGDLLFGYRDPDDELPNSSSNTFPEFNFQENSYFQPENINGRIGAVVGGWNYYTAGICNNTSVDDAHQMVIAFDNFSYNLPPENPGVAPIPNTVFIDDLSVECDPHEILVEVKEMVSETIDLDNCTKTRKYRVGARYDHCSVDFSKLIYNVSVTGQTPKEVQGEFFEVTYPLFSFPYVDILADTDYDWSGGTGFKNGYAFFEFTSDPPSPQNWDYGFQDRDYIYENAGGGDLIIENGQDIIWDQGVKIFGGVGHAISIRPGGKLTIKCTLIMDENTYIGVDRGGELIIDGGTLTACDRWEGIVLQGTPTQPHSNTSAHGIVITKNNAIIENAHYGIGNEKNNSSNYGGIVKSENTTFENCSMGVRLMPFGFDNESYFRDCDFVSCYDGVSLEGIQNIEFYGNLFDNYGVGILAYDSKFEVRDYNIFKNSDYGILSSSTSNGISSIVISNGNEFYNCNNAGISILGMTGIGANKIKQNYFKNCWRGIEMDEENDYSAIDNTFESCQYGVISLATGGNFNEVNCNQFLFSDFGNVWFGYDNSSSTFLANDFIETSSYAFDVEVFNGSVLDHIGTQDEPALNFFSADLDIITDNINEFEYWLPKDAIPRTEPMNPGSYTKYRSDFITGENCLSVYTPVVTDQEIENWRLNYCNMLRLLRLRPNDPIILKQFLWVKAKFYLYYYYWSIQKGEKKEWYSIEKFLLEMCGDIWKKKLYGYYMDQREYVKAEQVLNELADPNLAETPITEEDWKDENRASFIASQRIALQYKKSNGSYVPNPAELNLLYNEAVKNLPEGAYAKGLYTLFTGERIPFDIPEIDGRNIEPRESKIIIGYWSLSPNPAKDNFTINYSGKDNVQATIIIYSITGSKMTEKLVDLSKNTDLNFDVSNYSDGIYLIRIEDISGKLLFNDKLIVTNE